MLRHPPFTQEVVGAEGGGAIQSVNILIKTGAMSSLIRLRIFNCHENYFASSWFTLFSTLQGNNNTFTQASYLKQKPYAYLLNADVSLMLRRCPRGAASVGELEGVTVVMHWETDSSLWTPGLELTVGRLRDERGTEGRPCGSGGQFSPTQSSWNGSGKPGRIKQILQQTMCTASLTHTTFMPTS